ncbi:MAG: Arm DNA-binding domain-containing protein [Rhodospirillales bacterium]|nr:Arm DNA-binding domain-containing protein [Rhodospirillales bacterium]
MGSLTSAKAKSLSKPGLHGSGGTTYLRVKPSGAKSWIQRVVIDGKRHDIGLGGFLVVNLAKARERAFANRRVRAGGASPRCSSCPMKLLVWHSRAGLRPASQSHPTPTHGELPANSAVRDPRECSP